MRKIAIFVEGQTELIFTRELILKCFEYQGIWVECWTLVSDGNLKKADYSFKDPNATVFYQIHDVGNDKKVLSSILKREKRLFHSGFDKIIGLRDMYSEEYLKVVKRREINPEINKKFIEGRNATINIKSAHPDKIDFHFAIMELEAWLLGINDFFKKFNSAITNEKIEKELIVNLNKIDPEEIFHPSVLLGKILKLVNDGYGKKKEEVNTILGKMDKQDFENLYNSDKCNTFKGYCDSIEIDLNAS